MKPLQTHPALSREFLSFERRARFAAFAGFAIFVVISLLVQLRALSDSDLAVMNAKGGLISWLLYAWSEVVAVMLSAEFSVVYSAVAVFLILRQGLGMWSLAPTTWLVGTMVEGIMKVFVYQPPVPVQFIFHSGYPLTSVQLPGSYPSGHAMRTAFFLVFLGVLLWTQGSRLARVASVGLLIPALAVAYSRIYMGHHWPSDVVAGLILGASIALLVAPPVARRLRKFSIP